MSSKSIIVSKQSWNQDLLSYNFLIEPALNFSILLCQVKPLVMYCYLLLFLFHLDLVYCNWEQNSASVLRMSEQNFFNLYHNYFFLTIKTDPPLTLSELPWFLPARIQQKNSIFKEILQFRFKISLFVLSCWRFCNIHKKATLP